MCGSMADIQSAATEIRRGKEERRKKKNKQQDENIMVCAIPLSDHNKPVQCLSAFVMSLAQLIMIV